MIKILKVMGDGNEYTATKLAELSNIPFKYVRAMLNGMKIKGLIEASRQERNRKLWRKRNKVFFPPWVKRR